MDKGNSEIKDINVFIVDDVDEATKAVKSLLTVPYKEDKGELTDKVLRVVDEKSDLLIYASTRLGSLVAGDAGYEKDVTGRSDLIGKSFTLIEAGTKRVLVKGKILSKQTEAKVIDLKKAANSGK